MITDYNANLILESMFNGTAYQITTPYLGLLTVRPTPTTGGTEVAAVGAYQRVNISAAFDVAAGGEKINLAAVTFPAPVGADWAPAATPVIAVGIWDAGPSSGAGNLLLWAEICPKVVMAGDPAPSFAIHALTVALSEGGCGC